jgi:primosomal protein N' (replication factor Y)
VGAAFQAAQGNLKTAEGAPAEVRLLGPAEAPVFRLKGYYRYHFQLQSPSPGVLHQLLRAVLPVVRPPAGVEFTIDIDPLNML